MFDDEPLRSGRLSRTNESWPGERAAPDYRIVPAWQIVFYVYGLRPAPGLLYEHGRIRTTDACISRINLEHNLGPGLLNENSPG